MTENAERSGRFYYRPPVCSTHDRSGGGHKSTISWIFRYIIIVLFIHNNPSNLISNRFLAHKEGWTFSWRTLGDSGSLWLKRWELLVNSRVRDSVSVSKSLHPSSQKTHFRETMALNHPLNKMVLQQQFTGRSDECESVFELVINCIAAEEPFNRKDSR